MNKEITFDKFVRGMAIIAVITGVFLLLKHLSSVLLPFFIAWLIAYLLYPIVCFFQHKCRIRSRVASIIITLSLLLTGFFVACRFIIPPVIDEIVRLKNIVISYATNGSETLSIPVELENFLRQNIDIKTLSNMISFSDITTLLEERVPQLIRFVSSSVNALLGVICSLIAIIYLFFILMDYERINQGFIHLVPKSHRSIVKDIIKDVEKSMNSYFRGQSLIAFIVGILFSIGFLIIDFPLAIPLGLFIGVLNLVPYLQAVGIIPTLILGLLKAHDTGDSIWGIALGVIIVFVVVQAIQDWILVPRIMGEVTGLNAAIILLSLSVWGSLLGLVGLIVALPLTTIIVSYYKRYFLKEKNHTK
jgi:predicted PurR-regulated permease PerM